MAGSNRSDVDRAKGDVCGGQSECADCECVSGILTGRGGDVGNWVGTVGDRRRCGGGDDDGIRLLRDGDDSTTRVCPVVCTCVVSSSCVGVEATSRVDVTCHGDWRRRQQRVGTKIDGGWGGATPRGIHARGTTRARRCVRDARRRVTRWWRHARQASGFKSFKCGVEGRAGQQRGGTDPREHHTERRLRPTNEYER